MKPKAYWAAIRKQRKEARTKGPSKYGNTKVFLDGYHFDSKLEAAVYGLIKLREKAGTLKLKQHQKHIYLSEARILYIPDFECEDENGLRYVEAKGFEGPRWSTIVKMWKQFGPGPLEIWKGSWERPKLVKTIYPETQKEVCLYCGK